MRKRKEQPLQWLGGKPGVTFTMSGPGLLVKPKPPKKRCAKKKK